MPYCNPSNSSRCCCKLTWTWPQSRALPNVSGVAASCYPSQLPAHARWRFAPILDRAGVSLPSVPQANHLDVSALPSPTDLPWFGRSVDVWVYKFPGARWRSWWVERYTEAAPTVRQAVVNVLRLLKALSVRASVTLIEACARPTEDVDSQKTEGFAVFALASDTAGIASLGDLLECKNCSESARSMGAPALCHHRPSTGRAA